MYPSLKKYLGLLLTLSLALAPVQGVMAANAACDTSDVTPHFMMEMTASDQLSIINDTLEHNQPKVEMDCCQETDCTTGHCLMISAAFYNAMVITAPAPADTAISRNDFSFSSQLFPPFHRPPKV